MPEACATWGLPSSISRPLTRTVPESGESTPERTFIMVLLPAPFSPTSPCTSPILAANDAPSSAFTAPKDFEMPAPSIAGVVPLESLSDTSLSSEERGVSDLAYALGRLTVRVLPQGLPDCAAARHILTVASGPLSVKASKKLSCTSGKTVTPFLTVALVTDGKGMVTSCLG